MLFSFLMVIVHGMIPHHHHDASFFRETEEHGHYAATDHVHYGDEDHQHDAQSSDTRNHQHSAPFHIHTSVVHSYDFMKISGNNQCVVVIEFPAFLNSGLPLLVVPPPDYTEFKFKDFPIKFPPEPALLTASLRAPPVFA